MPIGKIKEFDVHKDDWKLYIERVEQYFVVNEVSDVPTLITVMGTESYELLVNLCTPVKPKDKTFGEIVDIMEKHLQPKPSELAERYKFRHRTQKKGEGISEYVAVLKKMSKSCDFGSWLQESLRDQLVCGISSESIRQRLFAESKLDFAKAYSIAVSMEAAEKDAAAVEGHRSPSETTVECQAMSAGTRWRGATAAATPGRDYGGSARQGGGGAQRFRGARAATAPGPTRSGERAQRGQSCGVCGGSHDASSCKFRRYVCRVCNRPGHLKRMCPKITDQHCLQTDRNEDSSESDNSEEVIFIDFNKITLNDCKPILISLIIDNRSVNMECDTGSAVSCISQEMYFKKFSHLKIKPCNLVLRYYTGETVKPIGMLQPCVKYKNCTKKLDLYVIKNGKTALVGRQWLAELNIQLPKFEYSALNVLSGESLLSDLSSRFCDVFADGLGRYTGGPVRIHVREGARPVFLRARPLAYALRAPVERALEQHVRDGILTPVERSDWATPIVPVVKKDGNIRICADYKTTLNKVIEIDRYPLPRVEDLLVRLHGGQRFSKIDLSQAYAQLELDDSKKYTVINTHKGLFVYNRLVYGLASSPGIFQRRLEEMFADLPCVGVFLDDIIITGKTTVEHTDNLFKVFERLQKYGLRVKKEKCEFFTESISYLGHVISKDGVHTCPNKIKAILKAMMIDGAGVLHTPAPSNVSELRSFIGMIMYYAKFVPNVSTLLAPLYNLLKIGVKYVWGEQCQRAFEELKSRLVSSEVLCHYSAELPLVLTADASSVGVGAVLAHATPTGERPVAYASRSLTAAERHYAQIDREALAIVFASHISHMGIVKTKGLARSYVWWPGIDRDVEEACRACDTCAREAAAPARASPSPWPSRLSDVPFHEEPAENRQKGVEGDAVMAEAAVVDGNRDTVVITREEEKEVVQSSQTLSPKPAPAPTAEFAEPVASQTPPQTESRYSKRVRKPVVRWGFEID
ncbi:uncharacterized protein LOC114359144 [Ostrinia furnacalis]|uniref:uncharacterized protein LOC114359144 n=1 Tax=Ostrinia furnacalis TaxID=93504 RepID=UPI00103AFCBD|nr:uncharacterized protein LOC114359144 [Ostrinia furnacalis]